MLKRDYAAKPVYLNDVATGQKPSAPMFARELQIIRKRWKLVWLCILIAGVAGVAAAIVLPARYSALVQFNVDYRTMQLRQQDAIYSDSAVTDGIVESQVEILKSEPIALAVIAKLKLTDDPEFVPAELSWRRRLAAFTGLAFLQGDGAVDASRTARHNFRKAMSVHRIGLSHIVEVNFRSADPHKAALIANTIADIYLQRQSDERVNIAKSASAWLRTRVQEAGPSTSVLAPAEPPSYTSGISDKVILGGFLVLGTCFGVGLALILEGTNGRIRNREDLINALALNCYGVLPRIAAGRRSRSGASLFEYVARNRNTAISDVIHHCRLASMSFHPSDTVRTIGVTSCAQGVGKSLVASHLASLMAQSGESKVLLIDANTDNPTLSRFMAPHAVLGLSQALTNDLDLGEFVIEVEGVSLLPITSASHGAQTSSMIWTPRMTALIDRALSSYDVVIFDLPSVAPSADVRASLAVLDVFLLVVGHGENAEHVRKSLLEIDDLALKISGTVLNDGVHL